MTGSRNSTVPDRLEYGEVDLDSTSVPESPRSVCEADTASGRQIFNFSRYGRRWNVAALLTVAVCTLALLYSGRSRSPISHTQAREAPMIFEEVKASDKAKASDDEEEEDLESAKAKVADLKKKLMDAQDKVKRLSGKAQKTAEAKATSAAPESMATTAAAPTTAAEATTAAAATTAVATTAAGATTAEVTTQQTTTSDKDDDKKDPAKKENKTVIPDPSMGWPTDVFWPTLFCFSVMNKDNPQEVATMKMQVKMHIGIASCERFAVLSGAKIYLGDGHKWKNGTAVKIHSWVNPAKAVPMGNLQSGDDTNSFKNTKIFINAWNILISSHIMEGKINWVVKADPDAVFFPERLRKHVKSYSWGKQKKTPMYFKNCDYKGPKLYGALEVFNQEAMIHMSNHMEWCTGLPWGGWGEDEFIDKCMERLQARALQDYKLVGDHRCMSAECEATDRASFHDYKSPELYQNCWNRSKNSEKWAEKMAKGHFFCCTSPGNPGDPCNTCNPGATAKPNSGWCGGSRKQCKGCGGGAEWCRFDPKQKKNVVSSD